MDGLKKYMEYKMDCMEAKMDGRNLEWNLRWMTWKKKLKTTWKT